MLFLFVDWLLMKGVIYSRSEDWVKKRTRAIKSGLLVV